MRTARKSSTLRAAVTLTAAVLSLAVVASPAAAQSSPVIVTAQSDPLAVAAALKAEKALADRYLTAARHYRRAANSHGDDTAAVTNLRMAAWSFSAGGDNTAALNAMTQAANRAERVGDVDREVESLVDAAILAGTLGRRNQVVPLLRRVDVLLASPTLSMERRTAILGRINASASLKTVAALR